jgi:polyphosphate kinase
MRYARAPMSARENGKAPETGTGRFVNRELSFLEFNRRILDEAADASVPLLERLKFVSIVSANLDEFFMVRVAGLKQQLKSGVLEAGPDGMLPSEQLYAIRQRVATQIEAQESLLLQELLPRLAEEKIHILSRNDIPDDIRASLRPYFDTQVFGMLTPMAVDPGHPFPFLKNRTLNLAVHLLPASSPGDAVPLTAVIQVPTLLPRFVEVGIPGDLAVAFVEDVITLHVDTLFPGMRILECAPFRVIRNWDLSFDEDEQEDLLDTVQKELRKRWRLDAVRLEVSDVASPALVERLQTSLSLEEADVQRHRGPLALADLRGLLERVGRSDLRDSLFQPVTPPDFRDSENVFAPIARGDILVHHPYESYEPVLDLLEQAATDPSVLAIKQTLYRMNRDSPLLASLVRAAEKGKQVTALVELKARFDEEVNVEWARQLEAAGVHVVYGMIGLKTHCKVTLVVRREPSGLESYVHLGTGNYNEETAAIYSDLSFFTSRRDVCEDIATLFNLLTGYSAPPKWNKLVVAPLGLRKRVLDLIETARQSAKKGKPAKIIIKTNALVDRQTIDALCNAANDGVQVTLLVRGPCGLNVGAPGVSDRIEVRMLIDRFLEHSRVLYFTDGDRERVYVTSTDIMPRNFDRRVEVMIPIEDQRLKRRIVDEILALELADNTKTSVLAPDGRYVRVAPGDERPLRAQAELIQRARRRARAHDQGKAKKRKKRAK